MQNSSIHRWCTIDLPVLLHIDAFFILFFYFFKDNRYPACTQICSCSTICLFQWFFFLPQIELSHHTCSTGIKCSLRLCNESLESPSAFKMGAVVALMNRWQIDYYETFGVLWPTLRSLLLTAWQVVLNYPFHYNVFYLHN